MKLTLPQLRALEAVAREGHISRAALQLGVSQPAISNHIASFESTWGTKLFQRDGYTITVTPAAEPLIGKIRLALDILDDLEAELAAKTESESLILNLGFSAHRLIMPSLSAYLRAMPQIRITTHGGSSLDLVEAVRRGDLHMASISTDQGTDGLYCRKLTERPLVVYGPRRHPLLNQPEIAPRILHEQPMVLWNQRSGSRLRFDTLCKELGVVPDVRLIVDSLEVAYTTIATGMGLGVAVEGEVLADESITVRRLAAPYTKVGQYLICQKGAENRSQIKAFFDIAESVILGEEFHNS